MNINNQTFSRRDFLKITTVCLCTICLPACKQQNTTTAGYLSSNRDRLLDNFEKFLQPTRPLITAISNEKEAAAILAETQQRYLDLMPETPFIGGDYNSLTDTLFFSTGILAFYRVMLSHHQPLEETGRVIYRAAEISVNKSDPLGSVDQRMAASQAAAKEFRRMATQSQQSSYPDDWKMTFIEGHGEDFDYGIDYSRCGIVNFYKKQGALELAPYICLGDYPPSIKFETGLKRTTTLARGGACCDFRFKYGRPVVMEWTPDFLK